MSRFLWNGAAALCGTAIAFQFSEDASAAPRLYAAAIAGAALALVIQAIERLRAIVAREEQRNG